MRSGQSEGDGADGQLINDGRAGNRRRSTNVINRRSSAHGIATMFHVLVHMGANNICDPHYLHLPNAENIKTSRL